MADEKRDGLLLSHHHDPETGRVTFSQERVQPARDCETLSDEQTPTGGDQIVGVLSMFGSYIRCGDSWDATAQQAYDRAKAAVAARRTRTEELETALDQINAEYDRVVALLKETTDRALNAESDRAALRAELAEARTTINPVRLIQLANRIDRMADRDEWRVATVDVDSWRREDAYLREIAASGEDASHDPDTGQTP